MITIITPCSRPDNLMTLYDSINFDYTLEWIIVYDENRVKTNPYLFKDSKHSDKIKEYSIFNKDSKMGNRQRNFAMDNITNKEGYIYFLDDDNIIHPDFYNIINYLKNENKLHLYTFNQYNCTYHWIRKGNRVEYCQIDTAQYLVPYEFCKNKRWIVDIYEADALFIIDIFAEHQQDHIYIDETWCFHNKLS